MGQKSSVCVDSESAPVKTESQDLKRKSKKLSETTDEIVVENVAQKCSGNYADIEKQLQSGDPPVSAQNDNDEVNETSVLRKNARNYEDVEGAYGCNSSTGDSPTANLINTDPLTFTVHPSLVVELGQLTALRMMQNFEEYAKVDELLRTQVYEMNEKLTDEEVSEKDFRTISYEDYFPAMHDGVEVLKQDTSTYTNEAKEGIILEELESVIVESFSCKKEEEIASPQAKDTDTSPSELNVSTSADVENDKVPVLKNEDKALMELKARMDQLESERDEAKLRLRMAEERCQSYESESRCLGATLGSMEERLRNIVTELSGERRRSKDLETQLTQAFRNANGDGGELAPVESRESTS